MQKALCSVVLLSLLTAAGEARTAKTHKPAGVSAGLPAGANAAMKNVSADKIRDNVKYLASDQLEGRGTGAKGGDMAADWIAQQFQQYGLKPAGDNGTYLQKVAMIGITTEPGTTLEFTTPKNKYDLKLLDDAVVFNLSGQPSADVGSDVVFVGYGITAPEFGWDDYAGIDVKGKVLLMLVNEPPSTDPKYFGGKALTYYGRWTYKYEQAARKGAAGVVLIHKKEMASYGWEVVRSSWSGERSSLADDPDPKLQLASWIQLDVARKVLADAGQDVDKLMTAAQQKGFHAIPLPIQLKAHIASKVRNFQSSNVIGYVEGSDPNLKKEAVLYTGHYDHLGIRPEMKGDNIYNGALDNASGTAMIVEMARAVAEAPVKPKRSMYFAAVTAEEQGLYGSEYLGKHLPVPADQITLNLNYDSIKPLGIPKEVQAEGYQRTNFAPVFDKMTQNFGLKILPPEHPEAGTYYRSDHFSLARVGVPAFSIEAGSVFTGHSAEWVKTRSDEMDKSYHQPSDEFKDTDDYRSNAVLARLGIALGYAAADQTKLVEWKHGDEFEKARQGATK